MEERYHNILKTTILLFNKYGIKSVSMDDICAEMGISKKTLYQFVNSKTDLVEDILNYKIDAIMEIFENSRKKDLNAIDILIDFSKGLGKFLKEAKAQPAADYDLKKYYSVPYDQHKKKRDEQVLKHVCSNIKQGMEEGVYRQDLNPEVIAKLYIKKMEDVAEPEFWSGGKYSFKKIYKIMIDNHIRGIANQEGLKYFEKTYVNK